MRPRPRGRAIKADRSLALRCVFVLRVRAISAECSDPVRDGSVVVLVGVLRRTLTVLYAALISEPIRL